MTGKIAEEYTDIHWMKQALELARKADGQTRPNPMVGCVIVRENRILGQGFHDKAGQPHAERNALADCKESPAGATAFVTLEPCNHTGRTPPCSEGLIEAGIARVVIAQSDPNATAAGGVQRLRDAGIDVTIGVLKEEARKLNPAFTKYHEAKARNEHPSMWPMLTLKWAMSADGCTSAPNGESKWITGSESRKQVHRQRAQHDAIMVGIETALADQAKLTVRDWPLVASPPVRVIVDSQLRLPVNHPLFKKRYGLLETPVILVCHNDNAEQDDDVKERATKLEEVGAEILPVPGHNGKPLPSFILESLAERGIMSIYLEGGRRLAGSFLKAGYGDRIISFMAPRIIGSAGNALSPVISRDENSGMNETLNLDDIEITVMENHDVMMSGWIRRD